ncbi:hypothetical protein EO95_10335 [Methanosarcina sp. 1.H.T.1A.1]|nr:hypothetical protein EO95_10335 [Methanosarcina sp. 1.H.T.1A.1]
MNPGLPERIPTFRNLSFPFVFPIFKRVFFQSRSIFQSIGVFQNSGIYFRGKESFSRKEASKARK